ncbi:MAG TPA: AAA family ATPase [Nocardioidaceae bacterium]|nr:AAA family ATPase [Nocardioidaceae bacterium]
MPRLASKPAAEKPPPTAVQPPLQTDEPDGAADESNVTELATTKAAAAKQGKRAHSAAKGNADEFGFTALDDTVDYLNVLLYGREGTAKTTSAAFAANVAAKQGKGRVLVVNAEGGLKAVALRRRGIDTSRIAVWPDPEKGEQITFKSLERLHERLLSDLTDDPGCWFAVIIDSLTDVHVALREQATDKRINKMQNDPRVTDKSLIDEDFVDRDDYGVMTNQLRQLTRRFRDLPCHVIITALERTDDKTGVVGPSLTPALAGDVLGYVDLVMYLRATLHATGEDEDDALAEFRALTRPGKVTRAKDRFDLTPRVLVEPRFDRILGYIMGELEEASDPIQAAYVQRRAAEAAAEAAAAAERERAKASKKSKPKKGKADKNDDSADAAQDGDSDA